MGSSRAADYDAPTPSTGVGTPRYNPQTPGAGTPAFPAATPAFESDPPTFAAPTPGGSGTAAAPTPYGSGATPALDAGAGFAGPSSGALRSRLMGLGSLSSGACAQHLSV